MLINRHRRFIMKVIDEKGKIFGKINIFDLFVLLALVIIIGLVGYKIIDKKGNRCRFRQNLYCYCKSFCLRHILKP